MEITGLSRDNRTAKPGDLFICTTGARFDTHDAPVLSELSEKGVKAFLVEKDVTYTGPAAVIRVDDTRLCGAHVYSAFYGHPERGMTVIGITGSKGKTTTCHMLADILREGGIDTGTIGTNGVCYHDVQYELKNTTPDYDELMEVLRKMADSGVKAVVLEVSSQAMKKHRCEAVTFDYGIWMNIQEGDHIGPNEHETFEDYMFCKAEMLNRSKCGLVHSDDPRYDELLKLLHQPVETFGVRTDADDVISDITEEPKDGVPGTGFTLCGERFWINFPGDYNSFNAAAAILVAEKCGVSTEDAKKALSKVHIKGRNDIVYKGAFSVMVDFAHNGESTWAHLRAVREYHPKRVICIFGADGNRSKGRRYGMGEAAGTLTDLAIVTSGHNRWETFQQILEDTEVGLHRAPHPNYIAIEDREEAIRYAIHNAEPGDFITILGLGHEHWQETMGVKRVYNDEDFVKQVLREEGLL